MKYLMWLLKAAIFFTLFAFALNNQQVVAVNFFFGTVWKAPLVMVVLSVFASGLALGVLMLMPRWWKKRRAGRSDHAASSQWASMLEPDGKLDSSGSPSAFTRPLPNTAASASGLQASTGTPTPATTHGL